jgi:NAD(P)-dependent dehydrogenase (short-subunit alcohol dehydrogenase family)
MRRRGPFADRFPSAFVTGGSSGLGKRIAGALREEGVDVWAGARSADRLEGVVPGDRAVALDLADRGAVARFLGSPPWERTPELLVNNAGYGQFGSLASVPPEDLDAQLTAMLGSAVSLARHFLAAPAAERSRAVVNVSSLAVEFPLPFLHGYNAAKAGLSGFSRSLALEYPGGPGRAFVLDLRPGDYRTPFNAAVRREADPGGEGLREVWEALEHHLSRGADPAGIWPSVRRALLAGRSRTLRTGTVFQARIAPLLARCFPEAWVAAVHRRYYRLGRARPPEG